MADENESFVKKFLDKKKALNQLKEQIEALPEYKRFIELEQEVKDMDNKIISFSIYDASKMGLVLEKLMTIFEGVECGFEKSPMLDWDYCICPKVGTDSPASIYHCLGLIRIRDIVIDGINQNTKDNIYLPSSGVEVPKKMRRYVAEIDIPYVQKFIDYVNEQRIRYNLLEITDENLERFLQDFVIESTSLRQERMRQIDDAWKLYRHNEERRKLEQKCFINRKLLFNSLTHIINSYEVDIEAEQPYIYDKGSMTYDPEAYHELRIRVGKEESKFSVELDPFNYDAINNDILFFEVKRRFDYLLSGTRFAGGFLKAIEDMYLEGKQVTEEEILQLLTQISNDYKAQNGRLRLFLKNNS